MGNIGTIPEWREYNGVYKIEQLQNTIGNDTNIVLISKLNKGINSLGRGYMKSTMPGAMGNIWFSLHGLEQRDKTISEETAADVVALKKKKNYQFTKSTTCLWIKSSTKTWAWVSIYMCDLKSGTQI